MHAQIVNTVNYGDMVLNGTCGSQGHPLLRFSPHKSTPYGVFIVTARKWTSNSEGLKMRSKKYADKLSINKEQTIKNMA